MLLKQIRESRETYEESPTYIRELVELTGQLADGSTMAERHTFSSTNVARLREIPDTLKELERRSAHFPRTYDYRFIPERGLLEVLTEHFTSVQALILGSRSRFSKEQGEQLLKQVIEALKTMHDLGITHGCISAQSVAVAADGSFKLGGNLANLMRRGTDFAKDVKDLGITCLQFFAVQLSPFETLSQTKLQQIVERTLGAYSSPFANLAKVVLRNMLSGETATDLYVMVNSWASQTTRSSVPPQFSIAPHIPAESVSSNLSLLRPPNSIPQQPLRQSAPSGRSGMSQEGRRSEVDVASHFVEVQINSLHIVLAHHTLDEEVMKLVMGNLEKELNTYGGQIKANLAFMMFRCGKCMDDKKVREQTILPVCHHAFCKSCYNSTVIEGLHNGLDGIKCPIDSMPFKPLNSKELQVNLELEVIKQLDELILLIQTTI